MRVHCTPNNGYRAGLAGEGYHGLCPRDLAGAFVERYRAGRCIYDIRARYRSLKYDLEKRCPSTFQLKR